MNILRVRCLDSDEFQTHFQPEEPNGGLFCPTTTELAAGTPVVVEFICPLLPNRVLIRSTVVSWRPALPRLRVRAGCIVRFDPDEAPKRDFIVETLGGKRVPTPRRKHARLPVGFPCHVRLDERAANLAGELKEVSVSGGLLSGFPQPALGTELVIQIIPPGGQAPMELVGRVLYHAGTDQTGVKFLFREGGGSRRLRELVRRFKVA